MKLSDWGEDALIEKIRGQYLHDTSAYLGIGDDCAVIFDDDEATLITTDSLVEGVHFLRQKISAKDLGFKSLQLNLSDIAAMGGVGRYAFLNLALPGVLSRAWIEALLEGFQQSADFANVVLIGGDTVGSKRDIFITITVMGTARRSSLKYRHTVQPGDALCITDYVGDSDAGMQLLLNGNNDSEDEKYLIAKHTRPAIALKEGPWLGKHPSVHAMMDISDGLDRDISRLADASQCGIKVNLDALLPSKSLQNVCTLRKWNPLQFMLKGGEDYCLLFAVDPDHLESLRGDFEATFGKSFQSIGTFTTAFSPITYIQGGNEVKPSCKGFEHF